MKRSRAVLGVLGIGLALALAFFIVPAVTGSGEKASAGWPYTLIYYDGHMHTTRSDGTGEVADIKATAQARGLKAVIITDHCKDLTLAEWNSLVAETAAVSDGSFLALPGYEMTGSEGLFNRDHFNAYKAPDPFVGDDSLELCPEEVWPSPANAAGTGPLYPENLAKWAEYVHSQGGIVNHNHTSGSTQLSYGVDNIEVYNQGHVDDIVAYIRDNLPYIPPEVAWAFAITINNFALYGERDLMMMAPFPVGDGVDNDGDTLTDEDPVDGLDNDGDTSIDEDWMALKYAIYGATGQWLGWPAAPLNSWDQLLMAYVNGEVDHPTFGVANSDAHNTKWTVDPLESNVGVAKNGLYVLALTPRQVYNAIEAGRSFATTGPSLAFDVNGVMMGGTAYMPKGGTVNVNLSVNSESATAVLAKIDVLRNGEVVDTFAPMSRTFETTLAYPVTERGYYRAEVTAVDVVTGAYQFAYANPVFVKCPFDNDCDGFLNLIEKLLGSDPDDPASTPEHILVRGTCKDGVDNDGDGLIDTADRGCPWSG
jgi:hypothetical protein